MVQEHVRLGSLLRLYIYTTRETSKVQQAGGRCRLFYINLFFIFLVVVVVVVVISTWHVVGYDHLFTRPYPVATLHMLGSWPYTVMQPYIICSIYVLFYLCYIPYSHTNITNNCLHLLITSVV